jgi:hypothetical protein
MDMVNPVFGHTTAARSHEHHPELAHEKLELEAGVRLLLESQAYSPAIKDIHTGTFRNSECRLKHSALTRRIDQHFAIRRKGMSFSG